MKMSYGRLALALPVRWDSGTQCSEEWESAIPSSLEIGLLQRTNHRPSCYNDRYWCQTKSQSTYASGSELTVKSEEVLD